MFFSLLLESRWAYSTQKTPADSTKKVKATLDAYSNKPIDLNSSKILKITESAFVGSAANKSFSSNNASFQATHSPFNISSRSSNEDEKNLNNIVIYPNPVPISEQLNLTYKISKDTNVTIKLMDVLGNEVTTFLPSEHKTAGEWAHSFPIPSELNSGMSYFVEIIAGKEIIVKRISII